ncbi:hypothetical protein B0H63DRAFT_464454 [Podospora didyma]|uniref:Apple domain-containing protein n=1 Tax=Podospora didyma TaxID=330526 RepID=A0AAE0NYB0_9PEZI|nr:hypothetical protein B0H63DRAFT_464454 [Podospora didyma]
MHHQTPNSMNSQSGYDSYSTTPQVVHNEHGQDGLQVVQDWNDAPYPLPKSHMGFSESPNTHVEMTRAPELVPNGQGPDGLQHLNHHRVTQSPMAYAPASYVGSFNSYTHDAEHVKPLPEQPQKRLGPLGRMKPLTFWLLVVLVSVVVIAASVGGAIAGSNAKTSQAQPLTTTKPEGSAESPTTNSPASSTSSFTTSSTPSPAATVVMVAQKPTSDCPDSAGQVYNSTFLLGKQGAVPANAGLQFVKFCTRGNQGTIIGSAYVPTLEACIELCASLNFRAGNKKCVQVNYDIRSAFPFNCFAASTANGKEVAVDGALLVTPT